MANPIIRFKKDDGTSFPDWEEKELGQVLIEDLYPVPNPEGAYTKLAIRSHGKGTFDKHVEAGESLDVDKMFEVKADRVLLNITFAWELAIAITSEKDEGKLVSHRFPQYKIVNGDANFYKYCLINERMRYDLGVASPGGAGRNRVLNKNDFLKIKRFIPCLEEQQKIASFFSDLDEVISASEAEVAALEKQKKGAVQKIFSQEVRFKNDDGSDYPEWKTDKMDILGTFEKGRILSKADISDNGIPMILYGELYTRYSEVATTIERKTEHDIKGLFLTKGGEVIIPCSGETPEDISTATCVLPSGVALGGDLIIFTPYDIDGRIISYILNHQQKYKIASKAQGKSIVHISQDTLKTLDLTYPTDVEEQQKIADFLSNFDTAIDLAKQELEKWKLLKKGLLQQMFV